jgi:hypothetical protein
MISKDYIGVDRELALLVILEALHELSYLEIDKTLLAGMVKNSSLVHWYPENRELPTEDPNKAINPWIDDVFNVDLPCLENMGLAENKQSGIRLTEKGRSFAKELLGFPQYLKFKEEIFQLYKESKGRYSKFPLLRKELIQKSKLFKNETILYDYLALVEELPFGVTFEPGSLTPYIDIKKWGDALKNRIEKKDILRAPSNKAQLKFLLEICEKYTTCPLSERPLVEVCGLCVGTEVDSHYGFPNVRFSLFVDGETIIVIAKNLSIESTNIRYHGLRVQGMPQIKRGFIEIEAVRIFDRGKCYPTNDRVL